MQVSELKQHIQREGEAIVLKHYQRDLSARPILGVSISKGNGKTRLLGIPMVTDRWLQQAVAQTIARLFEVSLRNTATVLDQIKMHTSATYIIMSNQGITG